MINSSSLFTPFKNPVYRMIWLTNLTSNLGSLIQLVAAGWTMTIISGAPEMITLVQTATALPVMLFSLIGGALADSRDRRTIMMSAQTFMLTISSLLVALTYTGHLSAWMLLVFTFLIACGTAINNPSWQASVGDILERKDVPSAVTLNSMAFNMTRSVGPAIGGLIVGTLGAASAFALNAVSYVPIIIAVFRWNYVRPIDKLPREPLGTALSAGLRYVSMSPNILKIVARGFLFGVAAISIMALLPLVARDLVTGGPIIYGAMLGFFGGGAIIGAFLNSTVRKHLKNETIARCAMVTFAFSALGLSLSSSPVVSCGILLLSGGGWILCMSLMNVSVQLATPRWVVGRTLAFYQMSNSGGMALGAWFWGAVASSYGVSIALVGASVAVTFVAMVGVRFALPEVNDLNLDPSNRFEEPSIEINLLPRSGPIKVTVEYEIAQADVHAFLAAMAERRRVRLRDGARHWELLRNLQMPRLWTETYSVPTWSEYVRHNQRRTYSDAQITEVLRSLHRGSSKPNVQRMIQLQADPDEPDLELKSQVTD